MHSQVRMRSPVRPRWENMCKLAPTPAALPASSALRPCLQGSTPLQADSQHQATHPALRMTSEEPISEKRTAVSHLVWHSSAPESPSSSLMPTWSVATKFPCRPRHGLRWHLSQSRAGPPARPSLGSKHLAT